jgi:hypothetical protein
LDVQKINGMEWNPMEPIPFHTIQYVFGLAADRIDFDIIEFDRIDFD